MQVIRIILIMILLSIKVFIIEFGGRAFATTSLTGAHWGVCFLCGFGTLLWGQFIAYIPTKKQAYYFDCFYPTDDNLMNDESNS